LFEIIPICITLILFGYFFYYTKNYADQLEKEAMKMDKEFSKNIDENEADDVGKNLLDDEEII